jgi:2-hydroxy-6-oxonona-2,4-dienedioate hydrolase
MSMNQVTAMSDESPAAQVARLEAAARRIETPCGSGSMVWHIWGEGPALVLLHGGYGSWTHWLRNIPVLAASGRRVIAADMPGAGESASAPEPYTAESLAAIVASGLDQVLGPGEMFDLAGFSFGGLIGGHVAAAFGARCRTFTLVGAGGLGLKRTQMQELRKWRAAPDAAGQKALHRENLAILMIADPAKIDELAVHLQAQNASRGRTKSPPIARTDTLARKLPEVKARLAGIWGERDATAMDDLPARARLLRTIQPSAPFIVIADAGHWVQFEAPDAFNAALLDLIRSA